MNNKIITKQDLIEVLSPWQQRIKLKLVFVWFLWGLAGAIVAAAILVSLGHLIHLNILLAGLVLLIVPVACIGYGALKTPSLDAISLYLDRLLDLSDRTATAWEMREANTPIALVQRADTLVYIKNSNPNNSISLWPGRLPITGLSIALVVPLILIITTFFIGVLDKTDTAFYQQVNKIQEELIEVSERIPSEGDEVNTISKTLEDVVQSLENTQTQEQAIDQLSQAEKSLEKLLEPDASHQVQSLQDFAQMLSSNEKTAELGNVISTGNSNLTIKTLEQMAQEITSLSKEDRNSLATVFGTRGPGNQQATFQEEIDRVTNALLSGEFAEIEESFNELGRELVETHQAASTQKTALRAQEAIIQAQNALNETDPTEQITVLGVGEGRGSNEPRTSKDNQSGQLSNIPLVGEERLLIPGRGSDISYKTENSKVPPKSESQLQTYAKVIGKYSEEARKHIQQSPIPVGYKELIRRYFIQLAEELE